MRFRVLGGQSGPSQEHAIRPNESLWAHPTAQPCKRRDFSACSGDRDQLHSCLVRALGLFANGEVHSRTARATIEGMTSLELSQRRRRSVPGHGRAWDCSTVTVSMAASAMGDTKCRPRLISSSWVVSRANIAAGTWEESTRCHRCRLLGPCDRLAFAARPDVLRVGARTPSQTDSARWPRRRKFMTAQEFLGRV